MAKDFEQVEAETKTGGNVTLDAEAQQSREAGNNWQRKITETVICWRRPGRWSRWRGSRRT